MNKQKCSEKTLSKLEEDKSLPTNAVLSIYMKHYFSDVKAMEQEVDFWSPSLIVIDTAICEYYFKKAADFCKLKKKKTPLASYAGGTWEIRRMHLECQVHNKKNITR